MSKRPHIVVGIGDLLGCGYYRCAMPYHHLTAYGFDVTLTNALTGLSQKSLDEFRSKGENVRAISPDGADALVLQRQHNPAIYTIAENFKNTGGKVVVELDDYFHELPANNPVRSSYQKGGQAVVFLEKMMNLASVITVSTPGLRDNYLKFNPNIIVCPNVIDPDARLPLLDSDSKPIKDDEGNFTFKRLFDDIEPVVRDTDEFRLGWAGSGTHVDDLLIIIKPVTELMREHKNIKFVIVGQDYRTMFPPEIRSRIEHVGHTFPVDNGKPLFYSPDNINPVVKYYDMLNSAKIHAAIAPIVNVTFNKCKSYVKLLEYGANNIPFVASYFGPYSQFVNESKSWSRDPVGLLADRNTEWKRAIKNMMEDDNYRQKLAVTNRKNVLTNHSIATGINNWIGALESVGIKPGKGIGTYTENIVKNH